MQDIRNFFPIESAATSVASVAAASEKKSSKARKQPNYDVLASSGAVRTLSQQEAEELWARIVHEKKIVGGAGCWVHSNKPNKKGYVQIGTKDCSKKVYTHHLAVRMTLGLEAVPVDRRKNISHICNRPACCYPPHLIVESAKANHSRKNCLVERTVTCPCDCKHSFTVGLCQHEPKCISTANKEVPV